MDPTMLCLYALTTGADANARYGSVTTDASKELYTKLKIQLQQRITGQPQAATLISTWDENYKTSRLPLQEALTRAHIAEDEDIVQTAHKLLDGLRLLQPLLNGYSYRITGNIQNESKGEFWSIITD